MEVSLLTPLGLLFALTALVPLLAYRRGEGRASRARQALGLAEPSGRARLAHAAALAGVCALLALAAAQPVVATTRSVPERTDAQAFVVVDTSRSMLATTGPDEPVRLDRARALALQIRDELPEVPMGLASLTDRLLPHLFPTTNRKVFAQTLESSVGIEQPPPRIGGIVITSLDALAATGTLGYFPPSAKKRVLVVLTDGEARPLEQDLSDAFDGRLPIEVVFVHVWQDGERIYNAGVAETGYSPDPGSRQLLEEVGATIDAGVFSESSVDEVPDAVRRALGSGPTLAREHEGTRRSLMPYLTLAAFLPLGLVLLRRNF